MDAYGTAGSVASRSVDPFGTVRSYGSSYYLASSLPSGAASHDVPPPLAGDERAALMYQSWQQQQRAERRRQWPAASVNSRPDDVESAPSGADADDNDADVALLSAERAGRRSCVQRCHRVRHSPRTAIVCGLLSTLADMLLLTIVIPIIPAELRDLGSTSALIGVLFASKAMVQVVFNVPVGHLIDRVGPRIPLLIGLSVLLASSAGYAFSTTYAQLVSCRALSGIASAAIQTGSLSYVSMLAPNPKARERAINLVFLGIAFGAATGPPLGSGLLYAGGTIAPFLFISVFAGIMLILNGALLAPIRRETLKEMAEQKRKRARSSARAVCSVVLDPYIFVSALAMFAANCAVGALEPTMPLFLESNFHIEGRMTGVVFLALPGGYVITMQILSALSGRFRRWKTMAAGSLLFAAALPSVQYSPNLAVVIVLIFVCGVCMGLVGGSVMPLIAEVAELRHPAHLGVAFGVGDLAVNMGFIVGPLTGPSLLPVCGLVCSYATFASILLLVFPATFAFVRFDRLKRLSAAVQAIETSSPPPSGPAAAPAPAA